MLSNVFQESKKAGLLPNNEKTKTFTNSGILQISVDGVNYSVAKEHNYHGQVTAFENIESKQFDARIAAA